MSSSSLESALVRILIDDQNLRKPVGAGFLVTPKHLITCAHVVNDALRRPQNSPARPDAKIFLDFSLVKNQPLLQARVLHWYPVLEDSTVGELEDIAVLELLSESPLPAGLRPAPIVMAAEQEGFLTESKVRMCGFPVGIDHGTYANGILQGRTAKGWVEIHHRGDNLVEQGFSGTAVWAVAENAVCGMTVSVLKRRNAVVAYMIPASVLIAAFPEMEKLSRPANPYRGLEAFREKDARLYFGREQTITRLQQVIADQPFAAVIGASGSGKSSVVFAGLVPALRQNGDWLIAHCRPKNQPLYELAACLIPLLYDDPLMRSEITEVLDKKFSTGAITLPSLIRQIREKYEGQYFLLIVDQFEELFTLNPDKELIRQYIDLLLECLHTEHFTVLCTMRADFFAAAVSHPALAEALDNYAPIILPQLDEQGLREAVEQPARSVRFADGLVDLIIRDVGQEPGSLPLLEFCLTQLWEQQEFREINHDAYKAIGGVQQALAHHADAVYGEFDEEEREQLRHIFLKLVRPGQGTEDTRQVASVGQIAEKYWGLITRLADKRLLVTGRDEERGEETVEVVHEALIRRWQTLRQWVDEEREFLVWQEKLRVLLGQWEESGKDEGTLLRGLPLDEALRWWKTHDVHLIEVEREFIAVSGQLREKEQQAKKRRGQYLVIGLVGAVILAVLAGVFGVKARQQQVIAERKTLEANKEKRKAEKEKDRAEQQTLEANYNLAKAFEEKALTALKAAEKAGAIEYRKAILFTAAALTQTTSANKSTLKASSIGPLFSPQLFNATLAELFVLRGHESYVKNVAFSPDSKTIVSASSDKTVRIWDATSGRQLAVLKGHESSVNSVLFSPDGKTIVSASDDKTVRIWDTASGRQITALRGHEDAINNAAFSPDGKTIVSASGSIFSGIIFASVFGNIVGDNTVRLWNATSGKQLAVLRGHESSVNSVAFSPDGKTIVSASSDKTVRIWDTASGRQLAVLKGHESSVNSVIFSPDGKTIVSASWDRTVRIWDAASGRQLAVLKGHERFVNSAVFSPDKKTIVSTSNDKTVRIWDAVNGRQLAVLKGHERFVNSAVFSPDSKRIVSASNDHTVRIWDAVNGKQLAILKGHKNSVNSVAFSPDGKIIVSASGDFSSSFDNTVRLWDAASGKQLAILEGHEESVTSATFNPDGKTIVSASLDKRVRLWDATSGRQLAILEGHEESVTSATFNPDGKRIASASWDKTVRIWDLKCYQLFLQHYNKPTPFYHTFIEAVKFLWQLDVQGLEIVETKRRTPADLKKYGTLLAPPPTGQSKFDQVLEWAEKQHGE